MIALGVLFALVCFSIIRVFVINFEKTSQNGLAVAFLFLHMVLIAVAFYMATKAFLRGPSLMNVLMTDDHGNALKKSVVVASIICGLGWLIGVYMLILVCGANSFLSFFAPALKYALMNVGFSVAIVAAFFAHYPMVARKN